MNLRYGLLACLLLMLACPVMAGRFNRTVDIGDKPAAWNNLPGVDGKSHSLADYSEAKFIVQIFTCSFCPCAKANEARIKALESDYSDRGVQVIAVNVGPAELDSLEKMKDRAQQVQWDFPYVRDDTQQVGRNFGATVTPHVFVLDGQRKIAYMGAIDDSPQNPEGVKKQHLRNALDALLKGQQPRLTETRQIGCPIEYEEEPGR